jgi:hypothetical protein
MHEKYQNRISCLLNYEDAGNRIEIRFLVDYE